MMPQQNSPNLEIIANQVLEKFSSELGPQIIKDLTFIDYHGFGKSRLTEDFLNALLNSLNYNAKELQVEIVRVESDLTDQVHYHQFSNAFICVLSARNNFPDPIGALTYQNDDWIEIDQDYSLLIPRNTLHGFSVKPNGMFYFLSIQTPPISGDNHDDYHKI